MKRYLAFAGLDGDLESLQAVQRVIDDRKPDALLFAGGVGREDLIDKTAKSPDLSQAQADLYAGWFKWLGEQGRPVAFVAGRYDVPLESYLKAALNAESEYGHVHLVEGSVWAQQDTAIGGVGGELTERVTSEFPSYRISRTMSALALRDLYRSDASLKVMLLATPPTGKLGGDDGSALAGELIDSYHPSIVVVGGPSQARGYDRVAHTYVVNPGRLADGYAAWIDWTRPADERVEILDLKAVASA